MGIIKTIIIAACIFMLNLINTASASEYLFNKIETIQGMDKQFKLTNTMTSKSTRKPYAILDCQSFFQKMDIKQNQNTLHDNVITIQECEFLYKNINFCIKKKTMKCIDSEDIFSEDCHCE